MNDQEIIECLIARDSIVTECFFFKKCRPLFLSIIRHVFSYHVDYEEFVNEFYIFLMENDAFRLRKFEGRSSIYQWIKTVAIRYFIAKRDHLIEMERPASPFEKDEDGEKDEVYDDEDKLLMNIDLENLFSKMDNQRYVYVIRRLVLDEEEPKKVATELHTNVNNLYNIKKRALSALTLLALKESEYHEKRSK